MSVKLMTPIFRASYAQSVWTPKTDDRGNEYYSISMIYNKDKTSKEDLEKIRNAIRQAAAEKWGADQTKWPRGMRNPLRDADTEDRSNPSAENYDVNYVNCFFMNAKSGSQPGIVDENVQPITNESEFYSGCYARATVNFVAYDKKGNKGVGCYVNNIMKVCDGERIGGGAPADADFSAFKKETPAESDFSAGDVLD